ncbi:MAG: hypothetical protein JJT96_01105 [Opitutales bacterium]|nr:hypothetical protein [Opitutales bacterium]
MRNAPFLPVCLLWTAARWRFVLAVSCLCLSASGLQAQVNATVQNIWVGDRAIVVAPVNASATAHRGSTQVTFSRQLFQDFIGDVRVRVSLLDSSLNPVPLNDPSGKNPFFYESDPAFIFLSSFSNSSTQFFTYALQPAAGVVLDAGENYFISVQAQAFSGGGFVNVGSASATGAQRIFHFTNTDPNDVLVNVRTAVTAVSIQRRWAIATSPSAREFVARVSYEAFRYDGFTGGAGTDPIWIHVDLELREEGTHAPVPLVQSRFTTLRNVSRFDGPSGDRRPHQFTVSNEDFLIEPLGQLDTVNRRYYVHAVVRHVENPLFGTEMAGVDRATSNQRFLHFNGTLRYGAVDMQIHTITNNPTSGATFTAGSHHGTSLTFGLARWPGDDRLQVTGGTVNVSLFNSGVAVVTSGTSSLTATEDAAREGRANGLRVRRGATVNLTASGATSLITAYFPTGSGYSTNLDRNFEATVEVGNRALNAQLVPTGTFTLSTGGPFVTFEETKPLMLFTNSFVFDFSAGEIRFDITGAIGARFFDESRLGAAPLSDESLRIKPSNNNFFHWVRNVNHGPGVLRPDSRGGALLTATVSLNPGGLRAHYPLDARIIWGSGGVIAIVDDDIDPAASFLPSADPVEVRYRQDCPEGDCGDTFGTLVFAPDGEWIFDRRGGIWATGSLSAGAGEPDTGLRWGANNGGASFAHATAPFASGTFRMPGSFWVNGTGGPDVGSAANGVGVILGAGLDPDDPDLFDDPGSAAYASGTGLYAGLNLLPPPGHQAIATLGDADPVTFTLASWSKYYVRTSGVSGVHQAASGSFAGALPLYGYEITLATFGLNFLSNLNFDSVTSGNVFLGFPSDIDIPFQELTFTCVGAPDRASVGDDPLRRTLDYWVANIDIHYLLFSPGNRAEAACDASQPHVLTTAVGAFASNIREALFGYLYFERTGELMKPASEDAPEGAVFSLYSDANATLVGLGEETYDLSVSKVYFNDFAANESQGPNGWINLLGHLKVPFFERPAVHILTLANEDNTTDPIWILGGDLDGDGLRRDYSPASDPFHLGRPADVSFVNYRRGVRERDLVRVRQTVLSVFDLDFPVRWFSGLRGFRGTGPITGEYLVFEATRELEVLTSKEISISFGASADALPQIRQTQGAMRVITRAAADPDDEANPGMAFQRLGEVTALAIEEAVGEGYLLAPEALRSLVTDEVYHHVRSHVAAVLGETADAMYPQLVANFTPGTGFNPAFDLAGFVDQFLNDPAFLVSARSRLEDMLGPSPSTPGTLLYAIDRDLLRAKAGLRAFHTASRYYPDDPSIPAELRGTLIYDPDYGDDQPSVTLPALFEKRDGKHIKVRQLIQYLVATMGGGEAGGAIVGILTQSIPNQLDNATVGLDTIVKTLERLEERIDELRASLQPGGTLRGELERALEQEALEARSFAALLAEVREDLLLGLNHPRWFGERMGEDGRFFRETMVRYTDFVANGSFSGALRSTLRGHFYGIDLAIDDAYASCFQFLSRLLADTYEQMFGIFFPDPRAALAPLAESIGYGKISGKVHFNGDSLRLLRLDFEGKVNFGESFNYGLKLYFIMKALKSDGPGTCDFGEGSVAVEAKIGLAIIESESKPKGRWEDKPDGTREYKLESLKPKEKTFGLEFRMLLVDGDVRGMGGGFSWKGSLELGPMKLEKLAAACSFGDFENFFAASVAGKFDKTKVEIGLFAGKTCTLDPLKMIDKKITELLTGPAFTGFYVYAEGWVPIYDFGCLFNVSIGVGAGILYDEVAPVWGGKLMGGIKAQAVCLLTVKGSLTLAFLSEAGEFNFSGLLDVSAELGFCPFCLKFRICSTAQYLGATDTWDFEFAGSCP